MSRSNVEGGAASLKSSVSLIGSASTARSQVSLVTSTSSSLATDDSVCSSTSTTPLADKQSSTAMIDPPDNTSNLTSALRYEPYVVITSEEPNLAGLSHVYCRLTASATIDIDELERAPSIQLTEMIGYGGTGMVCRDQTGKLAVKLVVPFVGLEPEAYDQRLHETLSEDRFLTSLPGQFPSCTPMFHGLFAAVDSKKRIYLALLFDLIEGDTFDSWTDLKKCVDSASSCSAGLLTFARWAGIATPVSKRSISSTARTSVTATSTRPTSFSRRTATSRSSTMLVRTPMPDLRNSNRSASGSSPALPTPSATPSKSSQLLPALLTLIPSPPFIPSPSPYPSPTSSSSALLHNV